MSWCKHFLSATSLRARLPLHFAVARGSKRLYDLFVRMGADQRQRGRQGLTVLHLAALRPTWRDALPFFQRALAAGVGINDRDEDGYTALHFAVYHGRSETVAWLLDHGANFRARTNVGTTPLRHAIRWRRERAARQLLEAGAFVDERDVDGETPLLEATMNPTIAQVLVDFGADVHACNHDGENLLHLAATRANPEMIRWALRQGVDRGAHNSFGHTPMEKAEREIDAMFGGLQQLCDAFAESHQTARSARDGRVAGDWTLVMAILGHPRFQHIGEA